MAAGLPGPRRQLIKAANHDCRHSALPGPRRDAHDLARGGAHAVVGYGGWVARQSVPVRDPDSGDHADVHPEDRGGNDRLHTVLAVDDVDPAWIRATAVRELP